MDRSVKSQEVLRVLNIAFYQFVPLSDLEVLRAYLKAFCLQRPLKGTILLSTEGINGTLSGEEQYVREFQSELRNNPLWNGITFKESYSDQITHKRMLVKVKKEIIPLGNPSIKPGEFTAPRLEAKELKRWLDEGRSLTLLDTRNEYEIKHGTFEKAIHLKLDHFRDFPEHLRSRPDLSRTEPLVMFCTGGIRCEKASVVALNEGFQEVYQLDGGILKYFEDCNGDHYQGGCFVFDQRVALDPQLKPIPGLDPDRDAFEPNP